MKDVCADAAMYAGEWASDWQRANNNALWKCTYNYIAPIDKSIWCYVINPFAAYLEPHIYVDVSCADNNCNLQETWIILPPDSPGSGIPTFAEIPNNVYTWSLPKGWRIRITNGHNSRFSTNGISTVLRISTLRNGGYGMQGAIFDTHRDSNTWLDMQEAQGSEEFVHLGGGLWQALHDVQ